MYQFFHGPFQSILVFRKTEAQHFIILTILVKSRNRYGGHTGLFREADREILIGFVTDAVIFCTDEITAMTDQQVKTGGLHQLAERIPFRLHKGRESEIGLPVF